MLQKQLKNILMTLGKLTDKNREGLQYINMEPERWWATDGHHVAIVKAKTAATVRIQPSEVAYAVTGPSSKPMEMTAAPDGSSLTIDGRRVCGHPDGCKAPNIDRVIRDFNPESAKASVCFDPTLLAKALPLLGAKAKLYVFEQGLRIDTDECSYILMAQRE